MPVHKLYVIQDGSLSAFANDERFVREFPFLRSLRRPPAPRRRRCGTCGSAGGGVRPETYQEAKRTIAGLSTDRKQRLKQLLDAKQVRVVYRNAAGGIVQLTF